MVSSDESSYRLDSTEGVRKQMRELAVQSLAVGRLPVFLEALNGVVGQLKTRPLTWGDPERRLHKEGGWVYHGVRSPLFVRYAVYEVEKVVCILHVQLWPESPLAE